MSDTYEEFQAYSQNKGHESMEITDQLYSRLSGDDVKEVIASFGKSTEDLKNEELFRKFILFNEWLKTNN